MMCSRISAMLSRNFESSIPSFVGKELSLAPKTQPLLRWIQFEDSSSWREVAEQRLLKLPRGHSARADALAGPGGVIDHLEGLRIRVRNQIRCGLLCPHPSRRAFCLRLSLLPVGPGAWGLDLRCGHLLASFPLGVVPRGASYRK